MTTSDIGAASGEAVLAVRDLKTYFYTKRGVGRAVDGVSFDLRRGEVLGLVGESGCGKSVTCMSVLGLNPAVVSRVVGGSVVFRGDDLLRMHERELRRIRGRHIGLIMQDPGGALDACFNIGSQLGESLHLHRGLSGRRARDAGAELLSRLRISNAKARLNTYPHQMSGGMQQRVVGAIAISGEPEILIADEPTTALDVTTQAAYLGTLKRMQIDSDLSILFVTHDLGIVTGLCDRAAIMYAGRVVEVGSVSDLFRSPMHPYTRALLKSRPTAARRPERLQAIRGQPPSIYGPRKGCPFADRCDDVMSICRSEYPPTQESSYGRVVECWKASIDGS